MHKKYYLCSLLIIGLLTFFLAYGFSLTKTNFSVIGNNEGRRALLLFWGAVVGNFCYLFMDEIMQKTTCTDRLVRGFAQASLFLLVTGIGIPYLPKQLPVLAELHVLISFLAPVSFGLSQFRFLCLMQKERGNIWHAQWWMQTILVSVSLYLLFHGGMVTSLLEIFLTVGMCIYLYFLHEKLEKISDNLL